jgi:hypothetical protein
VAKYFSNVREKKELSTQNLVILKISLRFKMEHSQMKKNMTICL